MRIILLSIALSAALVAPADAQHDDHHMADMPGMSGMERQEVARVEAAVQPLGTETAASSAGFHPALGWIPTMGTHWISQSRMHEGKQFVMTAPSQLMFSRIGGKDSLVGAAYSYFTAAGDTAFPPTFQSAPHWHEHQDLAPPGQTLVMLHVWFVPSPDGPFAGTNPNLPFWAVGLAAPDSMRMKDHAFEMMVRRASLALAEVADTMGVFPTVARRPAVHAEMTIKRDSARTIIAALSAAERAHDAAAWTASAQRAAALWDSMYGVYVGSTITAEGRGRVERYQAMLLGEHAH